MAQQLKLETFIDSLGFNLDDSKPGQKTQKLSIAGSSILLDIDFETDNKIVGLSLSVNAGDSLEQQNNHREIGPLTIQQMDNRRHIYQLSLTNWVSIMSN